MKESKWWTSVLKYWLEDNFLIAEFFLCFNIAIMWFNEKHFDQYPDYTM